MAVEDNSVTSWTSYDEPRGFFGLSGEAIGLIMIIIVIVGTALAFLSYVSQYEYVEVNVTIKTLIEDSIPKEVTFNILDSDESWSFTGLGDRLEVHVNIASTKEISLKIESIDGSIFNEKGIAFDVNESLRGPSIIIEIKGDPQFNILYQAEVKIGVDIYEVMTVTETRWLLKDRESATGD